MYKTIGYIAVAVVVVTLLLGGAYAAGRWVRPAEEARTVVQRDTVVVVQRDTLREVRRVEQVRHRYDTVVVNDTVYVRDEPRVWADSTERYRIAIEAVKLYGYELDLYKADTVRVVETTAVVEPAKRRGRWGQSVVVGIQAGYGFTPGLQAEPYVGIGITYGFGYAW